MYPVPANRSGQSALHAALLLQPARMPPTLPWRLINQIDPSLMLTDCRRTAISKSLQAIHQDRGKFPPRPAPYQRLRWKQLGSPDPTHTILHAKGNIQPPLTTIHLKCEHSPVDTNTISWHVSIQTGTDKPRSIAEMKESLRLSYLLSCLQTFVTWFKYVVQATILQLKMALLSLWACDL